MTLGQILAAAYDDQGYTGPTNSLTSQVTDRFKRYFNEGLRDLLGRPRLFPLRHGTVEFTTIAGQEVYPVPVAFDQIDAIVQPTQDRRLRAMSRDWYRTLDPGERSQGTATAWIDEGYWPVSTQPRPISTLYLESTFAGDTGIVNVAGVTGLGGHEYAFAVPLTGTTRVQVGSVLSWVLVRRFDLAAPQVGIVQLYDQAIGGTPIASILTNDLSTQYHHIRLWPTPSAIEPYLVDGQLVVPTLTEANDTPSMIPELYHSAFVDWINFSAYMKNGDSERAAVAKAAYERRVGELCNKVEYSPDLRPVKGRLGADALRWNNLGSYYPADRWGF